MSLRATISFYVDCCCCLLVIAVCHYEPENHTGPSLPCWLQAAALLARLQGALLRVPAVKPPERLNLIAVLVVESRVHVPQIGRLTADSFLASSSLWLLFKSSRDRPVEPVAGDSLCCWRRRQRLFLINVSNACAGKEGPLIRIYCPPPGQVKGHSGFRAL